MKLDTTGSSHSGTDGTKGQIVMTNLSLHRLIERACNVKPTQVAGPDWLESVRVDIAAKYPPDAKDGDRTLMLRTLLEDRFKLAVHSETGQLPGYTLLVAKGGFKLKPIEAEDDDTDHHGGSIQTLTAKATSMAVLADLLSRYLNIVLIPRGPLPPHQPGFSALRSAGRASLLKRGGQRRRLLGAIAILILRSPAEVEVVNSRDARS